VGRDLFSALCKMETIEHFALISVVARVLGRERVLSRDEVLRLQQLRGSYGIAAPAPICLDDSTAETQDPLACQVVYAPEAPGQQVVDDPLPRPAGAMRVDGGSGGAEIRLTYRELAALIEEAVRALA
jgi:L-fuculose-phosphate aldolase